MISKSFFFVFVLSFFVVGFFFLATPEKGFSQIGCCQNPGGNCVAAKSNDGMGVPQVGDQMECEDSDFIWFAGETCNRTGKPQDCPGFVPMGCCVHAENSCTDDQTSAQCSVPPNVDLVLNELCDNVPLCNVPPPDQGCCVHAENSCTDDQTSAQCSVPPNVQLVLETACSGVPQCNIPPLGTGCCVISDNNCVDDQTVGECTGLGGIDFVSETDCSFVPQCNVPPPGTGCCVIGPLDCVQNQNADECGALGGTLDEGVSCVDIPECVPQPIVTNVPTISQWGMIAMAGLMGIFSLLIIMRRHRYNVS